MCIWKKAGDVVDDYAAARSELIAHRCPDTTKKRGAQGLSLLSRSVNSSDLLWPRNIDELDEPQPGGGGYMPT